ncbi:MAG: DUF6416 domain-containing protein [Actinomycetota bacterium]
MGGASEQQRGDHAAVDPLVRRAVNAVERLGADGFPWTVADALLFVLEEESVAHTVAAEVAAALVGLPGPPMTAEAVVTSVRAAAVDFGRSGRGAAQLAAVADVAEMLPDLDADRRLVALDLLRRGGDVADLAVLIVPPGEAAPHPVQPIGELDPVATGVVAAHLSGQLDALVAALPSATRAALEASCARTERAIGPERAPVDPDVVAQQALWDDDTVAEWLETPAEGYEALYRAALERPPVRAFLDVLIDHPGRRMSGEDICLAADSDVLRSANDLSGALNGMRATVRTTGRSAPFRSWPGRPIRHGIHPTVAMGFVAARRRLLGADTA